MRRDFKTKYDVVNEIKKTMLYIIIINHMHISNNSKATASESQDIIKLNLSLKCSIFTRTVLPLLSKDFFESSLLFVSPLILSGLRSSKD